MGRYNYWSSSKLIVWIRNNFGLKKPIAATSEDWKKWRAEYRKLDQFMYNVTEVWPNKVQDFIYWPSTKLDNLYYYINARFKDRYYSLPSSLEKGQYYEIDTRMLYCNFQVLVDFVEIENAVGQTYALEKKEQKELNKKFGIKWYHRNRWIALFAPRWRSREAGMAALDWECNLIVDEQYCGYPKGEMPQSEIDKQENFGQLTGQAKKAIQIRDLYLWWVDVRANRPSAMDASGWSEFYDARMKKVENNLDDFMDVFLDFSSDTKAEKEASRLMFELEEQYDKEDQEKLNELISIRRSLWT